MARSTVTGMAWGAIASVLGAGALSVMIGGPGGEARDAAGLDDASRTAAGQTAAAPSVASGVAVQDDAPRDPSAGPTEGRPREDASAQAPAEAEYDAGQGDTGAPTAGPEVASETGRPEAPRAESAALAQRPVLEQGVTGPRTAEPLPQTPNPPAAVPAAESAPMTAPRVGDAPAGPPEPDAEMRGARAGRPAPKPDAPVARQDAAAPAMPQPAPPPDSRIARDGPDAPRAETPTPSETGAATDPAPAPDVAAGGAPGAGSQAARPAGVAPDPRSAEGAGEQAPADGGETAQPGEDMAPTAERALDGPRIGRPADALDDPGGAVSARLPTVDGTAGAPEPADGVSGVADGPGSPLVRNAAQIASTDADLPRLSVVLIDDGRGPLGPDALRSFPFPVSFALPPDHPEAAERARAYRAMGFEVLALAEAPSGATASDVEVALAGALDAVPNAVAVLESPGAGLQESRAVSSQTARFLAASGHGLVMQPKGLNTARQRAARAGVPSATLFRDLDGEGQGPDTIRRALDSGAFRARQEGAVIMLGRLRADTVSALVIWGLQDRTDSIALVPASTILREAAE